MLLSPFQSRRKFLRRMVSLFTAAVFLLTSLMTPAGAQVFSSLPAPGTAVGLSASFLPPVLWGMKVHPENPLLFDFIVDRGNSRLTDAELRTETEKLVKYFLAALTLPDTDVWVNLSPYEQDRILPETLARTEMGKAMLEQDYLLKQLSSSLTNPEEKLGQQYWSRVKAKVHKELGTTDVAINTFNKVWIVPAKAKVIESGSIVLVDEKRLKVMMAEDFESLKRSGDQDQFSARGNGSTEAPSDQLRGQVAQLSSQVFRETILPDIEKEINEGKNFAQVRQVYNSVILAAWYKQALKESLLGKVYADKAKVAGVETDDKEMKEKIYQQYLAAFKKGVYNLIKEDQDTATGDMIPRKYFSGGENLALGLPGSAKLEREKVADVQIVNDVNEEADRATLAGVQLGETAEAVVVQQTLKDIGSLSAQLKQGDTRLAVIVSMVSELRSAQGLLRALVQSGELNPATITKDVVIVHQQGDILREDIEKAFPGHEITDDQSPEQQNLVLIDFDPQAENLAVKGRVITTPMNSFKLVFSGKVLSADESLDLRRRMGISDGRKVMTLGSFSIEELEQISGVVERLFEAETNPLLVITLRSNLQSIAAVKPQSLPLMNYFRFMGKKVAVLNARPALEQTVPADTDVLIVNYPGDTLDRYYPASNVIIMGSNTNLIEPIVLGKPVFYMPGNMDQNQAVFDALVRSNVIQLANVDAVERALTEGTEAGGFWSKGPQVAQEYVDNLLPRAAQDFVDLVKETIASSSRDASGQQGALKDVGVFDEDAVIKVPATTINRWKELAGELTVIGGSADITKILTSESTGAGQMPAGLSAYHFLGEDGSTVIVVADYLEGEERGEAIFHETREAYWQKNLPPGEDLDRRAHILAAADEVVEFGKNGLTAYHRRQIGQMSMDRLLVLDSEDRNPQDNLVKEHLSVMDYLAYLSYTSQLFRPAVRQEMSSRRQESEARQMAREVIETVRLRMGQYDLDFREVITLIVTIGEKFNQAVQQASAKSGKPVNVLDVLNRILYGMSPEEYGEGRLELITEVFSGVVSSQFQRQGIWDETFWSLVKRAIGLDMKEGESEVLSYLLHPEFWATFQRELGIPGPVTALASPGGPISQEFKDALAMVSREIGGEILQRNVRLDAESLRLLTDAMLFVKAREGWRRDQGPITFQEKADLIADSLFGLGSRQPGGSFAVKEKAKIVYAAFLTAMARIERSEFGRMSEQEFVSLAGRSKASVWDFFVDAIAASQARMTVDQFPQIEFRTEEYQKWAPQIQGFLDLVGALAMDFAVEDLANYLRNSNPEDFDRLIRATPGVVGTPEQQAQIIAAALFDQYNENSPSGFIQEIVETDDGKEAPTGRFVRPGGVGADVVRGSGAEEKTGASGATGQENPLGGITFDPALLNLQIKRDGRGVPLPLPQQNIEQINIEGLYPVIINIQPVNAQTLPLFLGKSPEESPAPVELTLKSSG